MSDTDSSLNVADPPVEDPSPQDPGYPEPAASNSNDAADSVSEAADATLENVDEDLAELDALLAEVNGLHNGTLNSSLTQVIRQIHPLQEAESLPDDAGKPELTGPGDDESDPPGVAT